MSSIRNQLTKIDARIASAVEATKADAGATEALRAVVQEFQRASHKALDLSASIDAQATLAPILKLEQAGASAKIAATACPGISDETCRAIIAAQEAVGDLQADITGG
jgi:hypothetical protein